MKVKGISKRVLVSIGAVIMASVLILSFSACQQKQQADVKTAVPFSEVKVDDGLMQDYMKLVICNVIPTAIANVEKAEGGIPNIKNCALWHEGKIAQRPEHQGAKYVDSDVHKVLESMCLALDTDAAGDKEVLEAQAKIASKLNEWIEYYTWAPEQNGEYAGYFNSYYSLEPTYEKYSNTDNHELYCQGHFIEAAVAHYRYTMHKGNPDPTLLNVAINCANHICDTFGPNKRKQITGHQELELALPKLAKLCLEIGEPYNDRAQEYIDKAAFFLSVRGDYSNRSTDDVADMRAHYQDHAKVEEQMEPVGHAVRAQYMYTGMSELAALDSSYYQKYDKALTSLWESLTHKKQYVNGGLGDSSNENEGFADEYYLPNYSSYCETCAGVANMLWNRAMSTIYDGSQYADQIETDLYNNILGCVNFDGNAFYYENRLATVDAFQRKEWFGTACCPPNFMRTILQLGGYIYNTTSDDVFINQYISNTANFEFGDHKLNINMKSNFPYKGNGTIIVTPEKPGTFGIALRKPAWTDNYTIKVNGAAANTTEKDGYIVINQEWSTQASTIEFDFSMPLQYVTMNEKVTFDNGLMALRHGPILYCAEQCDNPGIDLTKASVERSDKGNFEYVASIDGKANPFNVRSVYVLNQPGKISNGTASQNFTWRLIPYYARCNRTNSGAMSVFLHDNNAPVKVSQKAKVSAKYTYVKDSTSALNDGILEPEVRWTNKEDPALNPWVQYNFDSPIKFKDFKIYWYEYYKDITIPWRLTIRVKNSQTGQEYSKEFKHSDLPIVNKTKVADYSMDEVVTGDEIRIEVHNEHGEKPVGIVEWEIFEAN